MFSFSDSVDSNMLLLSDAPKSPRNNFVPDHQDIVFKTNVKDIPILSTSYNELELLQNVSFEGIDNSEYAAALETISHNNAKNTDGCLKIYENEPGMVISDSKEEVVSFIMKNNDDIIEMETNSFSIKKKKIAEQNEFPENIVGNEILGKEKEVETTEGEELEVDSQLEGHFENQQNSTSTTGINTPMSDNEVIDCPSAEELDKNGNKRNIKKKKSSINRKEKARIKARAKHFIREPCKDTCSKRCKSLISEEQRRAIHEKYWLLSWMQQRSFILNSCSRVSVKRRTTATDSQRNATFIFRLKGNNGKLTDVCKTFYLTTLGYHKKNDKVVFNVLHKSAPGAIIPESDGRGKAPNPKKVDRQAIMSHVNSFHPNISHYRREHAPRVRYLPSDISVTFMHKDFVEKFPQHNCSYEAYRKIIFQENIRFTKLGHEECETCEVMHLHNPDHGKENLNQDCDQCQKWKKHIDRANIARSLYRKHAETTFDPKTVCVSADLEKIIMLPRMENFKKVLFTPRIIAYNETFVPVGGNTIKKTSLPFAALWHEAIRGRGKEELISTFNAFFLQNRDAENFIFWLDNCAAQNKNWAFISFLVYIVNSAKVAAKSVEIHYFEPGHTFMSADSVHHQIELSLRRQKKTCDFSDFVTAVQKANSGKMITKIMNPCDFYTFQDFSVTSKRNGKGSTKVFLSDIVYLKTVRGSFQLEYKTSFLDEQTKQLDFLKNHVLKNKAFPEPTCYVQPCGIAEDRKSTIIKNLLELMEDNRKEFWLNLPVRD